METQRVRTTEDKDVDKFGLRKFMRSVRSRGTNEVSSKAADGAGGAPTPYLQLKRWEIRVLELQPGSFDDPLWGELKHVRLKSPNGKARKNRSPSNFEAVSYVWGPPEKPHRLLVPGKEAIYITESLYWVLKYFRHRSQIRKLWADAVCINQADIHERNSQVAMMGDIYGACSTVLAWLGRGEATDALAFTIMQAIENPTGPQTTEPYSFDDIVRSVVGTPLWKEHTYGMTDAKSIVLKGLCATAELTSRTWFHRLWTAQEAHHNVVRKTLICSGNYVTNGHKFHSALLWAQRCRNDLPISQPFLPETFHAADDMGGTPDVVEISASLQNVVDHLTFDRVLTYSSRACSDPLDRVFAVRKILGLEKFDTLNVDYAIEPSVLYRAFITAILKSDEQTGTAAYHILATIGTEANPTSETGRPSWVPDLHHLSSASRRKRAPFWNRGRAVYRLDPDRPDELRIPGRCFAVCQEKIEFNDLPSLTLEQDKLCSSNVEACILWYITLRNIIRSVIPSYDFEKAIASDSFFNYPTPYLDLGRGGPKWLSEAVPRELRNASLRNVLGEDNAFDSEHWWKWLHWAILAMPDCPVTKLRRLWKIETGGRADLAWLPPRTLPGDQVCYFAGSPYPFVVRKRDDGTFTLIGDGDVLSTGIGNAIGPVLDDAELDKRLFRETWKVKVSSPTPWPYKFTQGLVDRLDWITLC